MKLVVFSCCFMTWNVHKTSPVQLSFAFRECVRKVKSKSKYLQMSVTSSYFLWNYISSLCQLNILHKTDLFPRTHKSADVPTDFPTQRSNMPSEMLYPFPLSVPTSWINSSFWEGDLWYQFGISLHVEISWPVDYKQTKCWSAEEILRKKETRLLVASDAYGEIPEITLGTTK